MNHHEEDAIKLLSTPVGGTMLAFTS